MNSGTKNETFKFEKRWPVGLTILLSIFLLWFIPERISLLPPWISYMTSVILLIPIAGIGISKGAAFWLKAEKYTLLVFLLFAGMGNLLNLINLIRDMLSKSSDISGLQLLASSIAVWIINVMLFSLIYWQIDRGGPESRLKDLENNADWLFPQETAPENIVPKNWTPVFVDYLYLGYSTSTAFSTTDVIPITPKAKLLMMLQSLISLAVIVVVGARAINILGS